ncbi:MAG: HNH endonuclease [Bacilli bacterium]|nr:HNH endonuclease [Bacilli bacterium]
MACTLLARESCSPETERKWIGFFPAHTCAYCGKPASHLDHLHPLIDDKAPTGYCTEPANLVPCCKDCNQPKGNLDWEKFMRSGDCHHVGDATTDDPAIAMERRIETLHRFEKEMPARRIKIDAETIAKWREIQEGFNKQLRDAEQVLLELKAKLYS